MDTKQLLGKRLKELRKQKNLSQERLAELIGVESTTLSNIENGRNYPLFATLEKILDVLEVNFIDVFKFQHHETPENLISQINKILNDNPDRIKDFYKIAKALTE